MDMLQNWVTDAAFMKQVFATFLLVATLGAGFTFQTIFAELPEPRSTFSKEYVQTCLAASWLSFILCVATAAWCPAMVGPARKVKSRKLSNLIIPANAGAVFLLLIGPFLASAEAVRAYQNGLGIATLVLVGLTGGGLSSGGAVVFL